MIPPSGRLPKKGPDWFLVDTEACGGETSHLGLPPVVWEYLAIYRMKRQWNGAMRGVLPPWLRQGPGARPCGCCLPRASSPVVSWPTRFLLVQKKSTKSFAAFGLRLIWIFCKTKKGQKTGTGTGHYVNRLVPKNDIKLIGNHYKTSNIDHISAWNNQKL